MQSRKKALPVYEVVESTGPQHKQQFVVRCTVDELDMVTSGVGESKRKAEQDAARKILDSYEND